MTCRLHLDVSKPQAPAQLRYVAIASGVLKAPFRTITVTVEPKLMLGRFL